MTGNYFRPTPAGAGNAPRLPIGTAPQPTHPRLHGEYYFGEETLILDEDSPPLTRGIHKFFLEEFDVVGLTPAYAGNTR